MQRRTWVADIVASGYADVRFFLGTLHRARAPWNDDEVYLDCPDDYTGIPLKVQGICAYAEEHGYDFTLKCDDDVYVVPQRFPHLPLIGAQYIGRFRPPHGDVYPPHFASGFAYWMDSMCSSLVARTPWNGDWMDERFVATVLARHGIFGYTDLVNYIVSGPYLTGAEVKNRHTFKDGTIFCEYGPGGMESMHAAFKNVSDVSEHPGLLKVPEVVVTDEILSAGPNDKIPPQKLECCRAR